MGISILLCHSHKITREGLVNMLNSQPGIEVVGEASDGQRAFELAQELVPDVIIMDVSIPDLKEYNAIKLITENCKGVKVIALAAQYEKGFVQDMIRSGTSGYLLRDFDFEELLRAVYTVHGGHAYLSPEIASILIKEYLAQICKSTSYSLTSREQEVLQFLAEGSSTKEIASALSISVKTVETHRRQIKKKLGVASLAELTKYAILSGITSIGT